MARTLTVELTAAQIAFPRNLWPSPDAGPSDHWAEIALGQAIEAARYSDRARRLVEQNQRRAQGLPEPE